MSDPVQDALDALATSNVYVDPQAKGISSTTQNPLNSAVREDDQIVLVMLPAEAATPTRSVEQIVDQINDATGGNKIIGLTVGGEVRGHSDVLPSGMASDLMGRADSITNAEEQTLTVFVTLVHRYQQSDEWQERVEQQKQEEQQSTSTSTQEPAPLDGFGGAPVMVGGSVLLAVAVAVVWFLNLRRRAGAQAARASSRDPLADRLAAIPDYDPETPPSADDLRRVLTIIPGPDSLSLPPAASQSLREIKSDLSEIIDRWGTVSASVEVAHEVEQITLEYIPNIVRLYEALPADLRTQSRRRNGPTPQEAVTQQLSVIERRLDEVRGAAYSGTIDALEVQGGLLSSKYAQELELD